MSDPNIIILSPAPAGDSDVLIKGRKPSPTVPWPPTGAGWENIPKPRGGRQGKRRRKATGSGYEYSYIPIAPPAQTSLFGEAPAPAAPKERKPRPAAAKKEAPAQTSLFATFDVPEAAKPSIETAKTVSEKVTRAAVAAKKPRRGAIFNPAPVMQVGKEKVPALSAGVDRPTPPPQLSLLDFSPEAQPALPTPERVKADVVKASQGRPRKTRSRKLLVDPIGALTAPEDPPVTDAADLELAPEATIDPVKYLAETKSGKPLPDREVPRETGSEDKRLAGEIEAQYERERPLRQGETRAIAAEKIVEAALGMEYGGRKGWGPVARKKANAEARKVLATLKKEARRATPEELEILRGYSGHGGVGGDSLGNLNEYFTPTGIAAAIWGALADGGVVKETSTILEPSVGTGVFLATLPYQHARVTGVELDPVSAGVTQALYPGREVVTDAFERFAVRDSRVWPIIVGNPPFGARGSTAAADPGKKGMSAEAYFLDTCVDKAAPRGVVAMVLPTQVLCGEDEGRVAFREQLFKKAELVGAWRLPSGAFSQAGTGIATDVVIVRKRSAALVRSAMTVEELQAAGATWDAEAVAGRYFAAHPERILGEQSDEPGFQGHVKVAGELTREKLLQISREGAAALRLPPEPPPEDALWKAMAKLDPERVAQVRVAADQPPPYHWLVGSERDFDGIKHVYRQGKHGPEWRRIDDEAELGNLSPADKEQVVAAGKIGSGLGELQAAIRNGDDPAKISALREQLRHDVVVWRDRYGVPAESRKLLGKLADQRAASLFFGSVKQDGQVCDLLLRQVDPPRVLPTPDAPLDSPEAAIDFAARMDDGIVNLMTAAQALGSVDAAAIQDVLYRSPAYFPSEEGSWCTKERFLSGYVYERRAMLAAMLAVLEQASGDAKRAEQLLSGMEGVEGQQARLVADKLDLARYMPELMAKIRVGIDELDKVRNATPFEEITLSLRSGWIPLEALNRFLRARYHSASVEILEEEGGYTLSHNGIAVRKADDPFWTNKREDGAEWRAVLNYLNRERLGGKQKDKIYGIDDDFKIFLQSGDGGVWRDRIENEYNRAFHAYRAAPVSQDAVQLGEGWRYGVKTGNSWVGRTPHGYQYQGIRWLQRRGKGILSDGVGLGKTLVVIGHCAAEQAIAREKGLAHKPLIVVPKSLLTNWEEEIREVQPDAKILVIGEKRIPDPKRPGAFLGAPQDAGEKARAWASAALNDWDFVLCSRESFGGLDLSVENKMREWRALAEAEVAESAEEEGEKRKRQKSDVTLDKARAKARARFEKEDAERKKLGAPLFEDVGLTHLYFDEGHAFKNLYAPRGGFAKVKYLGAATRAKRSVDMDLKCRVFEQINPGRGPIIATATPVKNSPLEVYTMLSHVAPEVFEARGIRNVEDFLDRYLVTRKETVPAAKGQLVEVDVVAGFKQLRELRDICSTYLMIRNAKSVGLQIPKEVQVPEVVKLTDNQNATLARLRAMLNDLTSGARIGADDTDLLDDEAEAEKSKKGKKKADDDAESVSAAPVGVAGAMSKLDELEKLEDRSILRVLHAMHVVSLDPSYDPTIMADYAPSQEGGPPQDLRSPKLERLVDVCVANLAEQTPENPKGQVIFCDILKVQHSIRDRLIKAGVPAERIALINAKDAPTIAERQAQAKRFQTGDAWVVIGNTATMGEGVNLQKRGSDLHHADIPWDPGGVEQRNGRTVRQGNPADHVNLRTYLGEGSFDGYRLAGLLGKGQWLNHLWHGTSDEIEIPPEVQGITKDSLYIFASADPEAAAKDMEEKKKIREAEQIDEKYQKSLKKYTDLRSMWTALRQKHSQAEMAKLDPKTPKPDETALRSLERSVEQTRRILGESVYFPHKDLLTDEALNGPAVVVPATGLVIKEGMNLILPRVSYGKGDPTPFHVTKVMLPTRLSGAVVAGYWYGTISLLDSGTIETALVVGNGSLDKATPTLRGPEEAGQLIVAAFAKEGPGNIGRLPEAFLDANEEALRSALRTWVLDTKAEEVALSGEITGWQKDPDGSRYLARVPAFAAMGQAQQGAGVFDAWVGGKADRERLGAYRDRVVAQLARGENLSPAELAALRELRQDGTIKDAPMQWVRSGQAEVLSRAKYADLWVASARAFGSTLKTDLDRDVADRKWLGAKTTAVQNGQLTWGAYKAAVGDEYAADRLAAGLAEEATWVDLPGVADSPDVASARLLLRAKQEQLAVAQRYFEISSEYREPVTVAVSWRGQPISIEATGIAYTAPEETSQGLARVYFRPEGSTYTQSLAVPLADLGLTRERVEAAERKAEEERVRKQEEYRLAAEAAEKAKREEADRVLAARAEKRGVLARVLRGKTWSATEVAAGLEVYAEGMEYKDIIALEHTYEGDTRVRFAFGGTFGKTPRGTKVIKKGGYGPKVLSDALIAEGWFWDRTYTNWNAPYAWKATQQRALLAKIALQFDRAKQIAQEMAAAGVSSGYVAAEVDTTPEGVAQLLKAANAVVKSLAGRAPLVALAGLSKGGPAILVGTRPNAGR